MIIKFNSNDKQLFKNISNVFTRDLQIFLLDFDFANTGQAAVLEKLFEFQYYMNTIEYDFVDIDSSFNHIYLSFKKSITKFLYTFSIYTTPTGDKMFQVASQKKWELGDYKRYREEADKINKSARELYNALKMFILEGKKRTMTQNLEQDEINTQREYNEFFNKINIENNESYVSGPSFFKIVNKFDTSHLDYYQYIQERKRKGLSTTRKYIFQDVLYSLNKDLRNQITNDIYKTYISKSEKKIVLPTSIENSNSEKKIVKDTDIHVKSPLLCLKTITPKVFISYSWDNEKHKEWILKLSADLRKNGIETILDRYELCPGKNAAHFMENSISKADKVLLIFTENYKTKAMNRTGGVGVEYSIVNIELSDDISNNKKYIPVLRSGSVKDSIPNFIRQYIAQYMTNDDEYEQGLMALIHSIFEQPAVTVPAIGERPEYITK